MGVGTFGEKTVFFWGRGKLFKIHCAKFLNKKKNTLPEKALQKQIKIPKQTLEDMLGTGELFLTLPW